MQKVSLRGVIFVLTSVLWFTAAAQNEPWQPEQLLSPSELAAKIQNPAEPKPIIFDIGPAGQIKGARSVGATHDKQAMNKLKKALKDKSRDEEIVLYCGCCPFKDCPNVRPAFTLLNEMKFTNHKLLNLATNLKVDWIDHGYPMQEE